MSRTAATHVDLRPNRAGRHCAYVEGTRVRVQDIYVLSELQGKSPDAIVQALPHLTLSQVHAALSYYFDHREEILQEIREDELDIRSLKVAGSAGLLEPMSLLAERTGGAVSP